MLVEKSFRARGNCNQIASPAVVDDRYVPFVSDAAVNSLAADGLPVAKFIDPDWGDKDKFGL